MQHSPRSPRIPFQFSSTLHKNLNAYALGATAAGVAAFAIVPPAAAEIVYTPADHEIRPNRGGTGFFLDLNHDGINDFLIVNFYSTTKRNPERMGFPGASWERDFFQRCRLCRRHSRRRCYWVQRQVSPGTKPGHGKR